jgi:hypothetical protein
MRLSGHSLSQPCECVQPLKKPAEAAIIEIHTVTIGVQVRGTPQMGMAAATIRPSFLLTYSYNVLIPSTYEWGQQAERRTGLVSRVAQAAPWWKAKTHAYRERLHSLPEEKVESKFGRVSNPHYARLISADCLLVQWTAVSLNKAQATALTRIWSDMTQIG